MIIIQAISPIFLNGSTLLICGKYDYFFPVEESFKEIYGKKGNMYGGELDIKIYKGIHVWVGYANFKRNGELTFTRRHTNLSIRNYEGGVKIISIGGRISAYLGVGIHYSFYKESNPIAIVSGDGLGYVGNLGFIVRIIKPFFMRAHAVYNRCIIKRQSVSVDLGGVQGGVGAGIEF